MIRKLDNLPTVPIIDEEEYRIPLSLPADHGPLNIYVNLRTCSVFCLDESSILVIAAAGSSGEEASDASLYVPILPTVTC